MAKKPIATRLQSVKMAGRTAAEVALAALLVLVAAETYAHRTFSPDSRYRLVVSALAFLMATLGFLPLILHFFPRVGRAAFAGWLILLALFMLLGVVTRP